MNSIRDDDTNEEIDFNENSAIDQSVSRDRDVLTSSDDDIPLSVHKSNIQSENKKKLKKVKKIDHLKSDKRKRNPVGKKAHYKNGKRMFCRSDSESTDFEKYTYFDESKTKQKIKLPSDLSLTELEDQIKNIDTENLCLIEEYKRIDQIKLKERLKLRFEIKRLKMLIADLKLPAIWKNVSLLEIGNTVNFIKMLKEVMKNDVDAEPSSLFLKKLKLAQFTDQTFWEEFNSIEFKSKNIHPSPLWKGKLDKIDPNSDTYYKPDMNILNVINMNQKIMEKLSVSKLNLNCTEAAPFINTGSDNDRSNSSSDDDDDHESTDSFSYNDDWNRLATRKKIKLQLQTKKVKDKSLDIAHVEDVRESVSSDDALHETKDEHQRIEIENYNGHIESPLLESNEDFSTKKDNLCSECGFDSSWSSFVSRHRKAFKNNTKLSPCNCCNMRFLKSGHFEGRHRLKRAPSKEVRPRSHICDICGQGCTTRSGLSQHRTRHAEARYTCPHCEYKCRRRAYLKKHIEVHFKNNSEHNDIQTTNNTDEKNSVGSMMYHCQYCAFETCDENCFDSHLKYHEKDASSKNNQYFHADYISPDRRDSNFIQL